MWVSVTLEADAAHAEAFSDALLAAGAISVSVEDAQAGTELETPQFGEPGSPTTPLWEISRVVALFDPADDLSARITAVLRDAGIEN
ncbi:MAG: 50S ribosomal protein L11 methyltransferase, partial [Rhodocyclaceae bacterium]|nr:50S ribosomal protein L11 methyltransferase [Rhodocyclaceae bacterium]